MGGIIEEKEESKKNKKERGSDQKSIQNAAGSPELFSIPVLIGHRGVGAGMERQENTIFSINKCGVFGKMAEIDVQLSRDLDVFVFHDLAIDGVYLDQISTSELLDRKIDTLYDLLMNTEIDLNIEIKYEIQSISVDIWCDKVVETVKKAQKKGRKIVYSSFNRDVCQTMQRKGEEVLFLVEILTEESVSYAVDVGYMGIVTEVDEVLNNPGIVETVKRHMLYLVTYGKNNSDISVVDKQIAMGVNSIITDEIEELLRIYDIPRYTIEKIEKEAETSAETEQEFMTQRILK
ncbi:glycerophosphodiester phosphodiesterase [Nematocida minor]|uniref:glycerophosphodiester phosphodiesterase n=1 Tax=Nematocida minor TaxID=1912983 RepID=UPI00221EF024|nr:glycerophosphodiester phosphodiesterase [Nematocida minor]KAI5190677.1 glycerophosphodiester phosphodiesterase [Nematocida minor]